MLLKIKLLGVHVHNPTIMSVGNNNNRYTERQTYRNQKALTHIKSDTIELCQFVITTTDRQTDGDIVAK